MGNLFSRCVHTEGTAQHQNTYERNSIGKDDSKPRKSKHVRNDSRENVTTSTSVEIKNFSLSIGENAQNVTINHLSGGKLSKKSKTKQSTNEKTRPFESYYTESSAREEERRQFTSPWGQDPAQPPGGNFIDTRELHIKEYVFESGVRNDAARWVCMICFPGGNGTGFRVGPRHIMTANHVVKHILGTGYQQVGHTRDPFASLQSPGVHAIFNFTTDGPVSERQKFRFKAVVPFYDDATDCAVLELEDNSMGTEMPLSFTFFSLPRLNNRFTFIGHSLGSRMEFNHVDRIIDNSAETQRDLIQVKQSSLQHSGKDYEMPPHNILTNPNRFLFHCKFTKGASGSPGVVILPDGRVVVVTMLLCGLPDWYYDPDVQDNVKNSWPQEYCVEQGVNLKSVYEKMSRDNATLCQQIFFDHLDSIPNPNI
ncbi:uncharacterized protein LOC132735827 [Ruditapes philippinarum]|uniref:uncharacterized protein LOC132735827 n=1 Tax=Ruditapes philippinarum TaxID=129788 RepID=UPI00295B745B|nr:uncharacterized protein LOC132735827 [Ruditapes philippinarum]